MGDEVRRWPLDAAELAAAKASHVGVGSSIEGFAAHLAALWPTPPPDGVALELGDLFLAYAALARDPEAVRQVAGLLGRVVRQRGARLGLAASELGDLEAELLARLLVGKDDEPVALAGYRGRGPLAAFLGAAVANDAAAVHRRRAAKREDMGSLIDDLAASLTAGSPEAMVVHGELGESIKACLQEALVALAHRDRVVIRLAYVQGLTTDQLAKVYGIDRGTASRWTQAARERLWEAAATLLQTKHPEMSARELVQLVQGLGSRLDLSLSRVLNV